MSQPETSSDPTHPDEPAAQHGAGALVLPLQIVHGVAPAPAAPFSNSKLETRNAELPRADQIIELGRMRECVKLLAEEIEAGWQRIIEEQQQIGWPDFDMVRDATAALHQEAQALDNQLFESVLKLRWKP